MLSKRISVLLPTLLVCLCALLLCACGEQERQAPDLSRSNIVVTNRTITVNGFEGALYSKDSGATWQEENVFSELVYGSTYGICVKYAETDDFKESPASEVVEIQIIKTPAATPILRSENFVVNGNRVEIVGFNNELGAQATFLQISILDKVTTLQCALWKRRTQEQVR